MAVADFTKLFTNENVGNVTGGSKKQQASSFVGDSSVTDYNYKSYQTSTVSNVTTSKQFTDARVYSPSYIFTIDSPNASVTKKDLVEPSTTSQLPIALNVTPSQTSSSTPQYSQEKTSGITTGWLIGAGILGVVLFGGYAYVTKGKK